MKIMKQFLDFSHATFFLVATKHFYEKTVLVRVTTRPILQKKIFKRFLGQKWGPFFTLLNDPYGQNEVFGHFLEFGSFVWADFAYSVSSQRYKHHGIAAFWSKNLGFFSQKRSKIGRKSKNGSGQKVFGDFFFKIIQNHSIRENKVKKKLYVLIS